MDFWEVSVKLQKVRLTQYDEEFGVVGDFGLGRKVKNEFSLTRTSSMLLLVLLVLSPFGRYLIPVNNI